MAARSTALTCIISLIFLGTLYQCALARPYGEVSLAKEFKKMYGVKSMAIDPKDVMDEPDGTMTEIVSLSLPCPHNKTTIDCSFKNLTTIPTDKFPTTVAIFDLHNNSITVIPDRIFAPYTQLTHLDISNNKLTTLEPSAFVGLSKLTHLTLWNNALTMTTWRFPPIVFTPLVSLTELWINRNTPMDVLNETSLEYPDRALSPLTALESLYLDGLTDKNLGPGFQNLMSLKTLVFSGYSVGHCKIYSLSSVMFQYVPDIEVLALDGCKLIGEQIQPQTFLPLRKLVSLNVSHNEEIGLDNLKLLFYGLENTTTLKFLYMGDVINRHSIGICLDSSHIQHFPKHLEYLFAGNNVFEGLQRDLLGKLSPSLKILDVSANNFAFGTYFLDLPQMQNLTLFRYNEGNFTRTLPHVYPYKVFKSQNYNSNCSLYQLKDSENFQPQPFILHLPPNLRVVEMHGAGLRADLTELIVDPNNKLENLSLVANDFPLLQGPFVGLNSLRHFVLQYNNIREISNSFFQNLSHIETLDLGSNLLGDFFNSSTNISVFSSLTNLTFLNMTFCDIRRLPVNIFTGLTKLKDLLLRRNPLYAFDMDISELKELEYLDLKNTRVAFLPSSVTGHLDNLVSLKIKVNVNLARSPVACTCDHVDFINWMVNTHVQLLDQKDYQCQYSDASTCIVTDGYNQTVQILNRQCSSGVVVFLLSSALTIIAVVVILVAIVYRFRWKLRYLYYAAYLQYKHKSNSSTTEYTYDVFISYATEDENFVQETLSPELERRGIKLCIHGRDFRAGEYIATNVVRAVGSSRRTVVVLTRHMMNSYWCGYEIQMANMESVHTGRPVLIFLLMEKIPESELGVELLYNIRNNTYIPYPDPLPDATSMGRLWDKLTEDIRS